jgi:outer membrane protein assembly factor BamB
VADGRVFAGSGYDTFALLCFDAGSGKEVWRTPVPYRSFGPPLVSGAVVFYGLGTGNLTLDVEGDEKEPAGAVVSLDAATGEVKWKYDLGRSVHAPLAADGFSVYACSRDGHVHCLDRKTGKLRWKTQIGGAVTAGAAVAAGGGVPVAVYAVSREGNAVCLNPHTGRVVWQQQLPGFHWNGQDAYAVFSTPAVVTDGTKRTIYIGGMRLAKNSEAKAAAVFRFDDEIGGE